MMAYYAFIIIVKDVFINIVYVYVEREGDEKTVF